MSLNVITLLVWCVTILVSLPMWIVIAEAVMALGYRPRRDVPTQAGPMPDTVLLIPAHNEEQVFGRTLESLVSDCGENCRILCVAHNCSDGTAEIARRFGVEVLEVNDAGTGGKPDALKAGLRSLDERPPEIVVIVDADCLVRSGTIPALAIEAKRLGHPVMGAYFFAPAEEGGGQTGLSSLAVMLKNYIRPLGLHRLGMPCLLNGSGSAYPFDLIRNAPHGEGSIAEDYQLTVDLLGQGHRTTFLPKARVDGLLPRQQKTALRQRRRWEHGHLFLSFDTAPRMLWQGICKFDKDLIALALELAVPPLAFLALMWMVGAALSLPLLVLHQPGPLLFMLATGAIFVLSVLVAWLRFAGADRSLSALAAVPGYLLWKLPIYHDFFVRRETRWMKTGRD
jgi:cellulose synthase/poly-beta-1,6-N-acetylglucosamine synthase-like glycosyltransferase